MDGGSIVTISEVFVDGGGTAMKCRDEDLLTRYSDMFYL